MSRFDDFLVLEPRGSLSLEGGEDAAIQPGLDSPLKPTTAGLKLIDAPNRVSNGLAYRINGCNLERIIVSEGEDDNSNTIKIVGSCSLSSSAFGAVHLKASPDGRMVAVACIDGSLQCFDSTSTGMSMRWFIPNAHSHVSPNICSTVSADRSHAACASGPILALDFSPHDYILVLVDATKGVTLYDTRVITPTNMIPAQNSRVQALLQNVSCASWRASFSTKADRSDRDTMPIAIGRYDGSVAILRYSHPKSSKDPVELIQSISEFGRPSNEDGFVCTHLNWTKETLVAGLCLVVPPEDNEEPDEDDEDDNAEHQACLFVTTVDETLNRSVEWSEQGDVVSFFTVPKFGRHVFFTSILCSSTQTKLIAVATNVGTDIGIVSPDDGESSWQTVEFQEGAAATTPTNNDDEYVFPLGICVVQLSSSSFRLLLASTDGSLSAFEYQHFNDPNYFSSPALGSVANLPSDPLEIVAVASIGALTPENASWVVVDDNDTTASSSTEEAESARSTAKLDSSLAFGGSSGSTSAFSSNDEPQDANTNAAAKTSGFSFGAMGTTAFGSSSKLPTVFGSGTSPSAFGSGTSSKLTFGSPSMGISPFAAFGKKAGETATSSIFGATSPLGGTTSSSFGAPSSAFGSPSLAFGTTSSLGGGTVTPTPTKAPAEPVTTFGFSGSTFGSSTPSSTGGFAALSASSKNTTNLSGGFGSVGKVGTTGGNLAFGSSPSPFNTFSVTDTPSSTAGGFPIKPLFGTPSTKSSSTSSSRILTTGRDQSSQPPSKTPTLATKKIGEEQLLKSKEMETSEGANDSNDGSMSDAEKAAAKVFDELDVVKTGSLELPQFEELSEALGEGFHGDEYDAQVALVDPFKSGKITRINFVNWYKSLVDGSGGDDDSLDTADLEEREEEKESAKAAFGKLCKIEGGKAFIGTDQFGKLIESLGSVYCEEEHKKTIKKLKKDKSQIYESDFLDWYVEWLFGDGDDSDDDNDDSDNDEPADVASGEKDEGISESLGSFFKIDESSWKCGVCSVRNKDTVNKCVACDSIRPGFEGTDAALGGAPAKVGLVPSSSIGAGGFAFGGATVGKSDGVSSSSIGSGGFSFGGSTAKSEAVSSSSIGTGGFSFGGSTAKSDTVSSSSIETGGFSFGGSTAKSNAVSSSSIGTGGFSFGAKASNAFTSISSKAPTSFLTKPAAKPEAQAPASSSASAAFPPMSKKAPTPFGGKPVAKASVTSISNAAFPPMSSKAPTPFGGKPVAKDSASGSSIAAFPPMSSKAPTPFGGKPVAKASTSGSSNVAFPPMSSKAPTPFGGKPVVKASASGSSNAAFPPMSSKVPTPFGGKLVTKAGSSNGVFPPMSSKAPTPFGGKPVAKASTSGSSNAAFPPMSSKAPTPFGGKPVTKAGSLNAAFPPMSSKAPTPVGGKPVSKAVSLNAAFPPMSSKAPTPFGGKPVSKAVSSNAAFPPMSSNAPTPFGGKPVTRASTSGSSSAAFPPMSSKAPTPFGAKSVAKTPESSNSNAAFPPMSSKAPTPFGVNATIKTSSTGSFSMFGTKATEKATSSIPSTAFGVSSTRISSSSPFGGMGNMSTGKLASNNPFATSQISSINGPSPFGVKSAANASAISSNAAFPPLSNKAPTPFGGQPVAKTPASDSLNAAFPPMSSKAPTPFGAKPAAKAPTSSSSNTAFPPMSSKAPTPFGAKPVTKASTSSSSSAVFPPMSSKAPTPFGGKLTAKASTSSSSSAAFPPMSSKAPTPFGAKPIGKAPTSNNSTSAFPVMSSKTPLSFEAKASKPVDKSPALSMNTISSSSTVISTRSGGPPSQNSKGQVVVARKKKTKLQLQLDSVISRFSSTLAEVSQMRANVCADDHQIRKGIESFAIQIEQERSNLIYLDQSHGENRAETAFLLSRKTDSSRQINTASKIVQEIKLSNTEGKESIAGSQALDQESEKKRRKFAASSRSLVRKMALGREKADLLEAIGNNREDGKHGVLRGVMNLYQRSMKFEEVSSSIARNIDLDSKTVRYHNKTKRTTGRSTYSLESSPFKSPKRHHKLRPISIESARQVSTKRQTTQSESLVSHWKKIESKLKEIGNDNVQIDRFNTLSIEGTQNQVSRDRNEIGQHKSLSHSLLTSPFAKASRNPVQEQTLSVSKKISIFSPRSKTKARSDWDKPSTIDKVRLDQLSLNAPRDLKQTTLSNASRETLASFGTTPEKLKAAIDIKKNETTSLPTSIGKAHPKDRQSKRSTVAVAAFPPSSNKAPTNPFSTGKKRETVNSVSSEKNSTQKSTSSSAPLPPMPKQAPKNPFSKGSAPKPSEKVEFKENVSSSATFGNMKGLGDSLFSSGSANTDAKQRPSFGASNPTQPTTSSETSNDKDYKAILTTFYQKHNASRLGEVDKTLLKYKGREQEMFQKLSSKYKVPNPLQEPSNLSNSAAISAGAISSSSGFGKLGSAPLPSAPTPSSGFGNTSSKMGASSFASPSGTPTQQKTTLSSSPFGSQAPSSSPFGSSAGGNAASKSGMFQPTQSPFAASNSQTNSTPFGSSSAQTQSPFGNASSANNNSPFGATGGLSSASPFGGTTAPTPFGAPSQSPMQPNSQRLYNGKTARDLLHQFYQEKNPSKVAEVDKLLAKYSGKEEQMFRNLAKKYQLDPSVFGISPAAPTRTPGFGSSAVASSFGQPSTMGTTASPFGQSSGGFGQPSALGGGGSSMSGPNPGQTFGSGATSGFGSSGFGSLAQSSPSPFGGQSNGFGAPAPAFGSPSPFGAPRR